MEMSPQMLITGRQALLNSNPQSDADWVATGQLMIGYTQALIAEAQKQRAEAVEAQAAKVAADAKSNGTKPLTKKRVSKAVKEAITEPVAV